MQAKEMDGERDSGAAAVKNGKPQIVHIGWVTSSAVLIQRSLSVYSQFEQMVLIYH